MNRKYTLAQFDRLVGSIRSRFPHAAITTDLIVGFPGETEDDFDATLAYVETGVFANAFTFIYSIRRGTPAARWEQVPQDVTAARFARLADAQNLVTRRYHDRMEGRVVRALIAGESKKDATRLAAKTPDNVTVVAPKPPEYPAVNTPWLDVAIESAHVWGCTGRVVARAARFSQAGEPVGRPVIDLI